MKCTVIFEGTNKELDEIKSSSTYTTTVCGISSLRYFKGHPIYKEVNPIYRYRTLKELVDMYGDEVDIKAEFGWVYINVMSLEINKLGQPVEADMLPSEDTKLWDDIFITSEEAKN